MGKHSNVTNEQFVHAWQAGASFNDVANTLAAHGMEPTAVRSRASYLRKVGVPLQKFRRQANDYSGLIDLANRLGGQQIAAKK